MDGALDQLQRRAALVASELVTNSVRHARGGVSLGLADLGGDWVVVVADSSSAPPQLRDSGLLSDTGRGMLIVARVSRLLGWARTPTGKVVWAQVSATTPAP
jgi:anti-sigma regulatory factor (Ser/Thr protein kinase)